MAEAILTGEQVEEFSLIEKLALLAFILAEIARFPKDFLMRNGPRDAGDSEAQQQKEAKLMRQRLTKKARLHVRVSLLPATAHLDPSHSDAVACESRKFIAGSYRRFIFRWISICTRTTPHACRGCAPRHVMGSQRHQLSRRRQVCRNVNPSVKPGIELLREHNQELISK